MKTIPNVTDLPVGIYELTVDVENTTAMKDRRQAHDWRAVPVWTAGTRFYVTAEEADRDLVKALGDHVPASALVTKHIYSGPYSHQAVRLMGKTGDTRVAPASLVAGLVRVEPVTTRDRLMYRSRVEGRSVDHLLAEAFDLLIASGKITAADVDDAFDAAQASDV